MAVADIPSDVAKEFVCRFIPLMPFTNTNEYISISHGRTSDPYRYVTEICVRNNSVGAHCSARDVKRCYPWHRARALPSPTSTELVSCGLVLIALPDLGV